MWHEDEKGVSSCLLRLLSEHDCTSRLNSRCVPSTVPAYALEVKSLSRSGACPGFFVIQRAAGIACRN